MPERWPFTGRLTELAFIERAMARPAVAGVAIVGDAGVGKTRLARELVAAAGQGRTTEWVAGLGTVESIPFGAFAHLLSVPSPGAIDALSRYSGMIADIAGRAAGGPLLLVVDDAHLLDDASASLVYELAQAGAAFVVATVRSSQPVPEPISALWREELVDRLELQHLSEADVGVLLDRVLGVPVEAATLRRLWAATRGNALLLHELVLDLVGSGALVADGPTARLTAPLEVGPRLLEVVEARLRNVTAPERAVLETLALGEPLSADALHRLAAPETVEGMERRGLLEVTSRGGRLTVRLAHPLYSEALRSAIPRLAAHEIMRRLAEAVEATGMPGREDLMRVATWRLEAREGASPDLLIAAAWRAHSFLDHVTAERMARAAVEVGGGTAATVALAEALIGQNRRTEAEELLRPLDVRAVDEQTRTRIAISRASNLYWGLGRADAAFEVVRETRGTLESEHLVDFLAAMEATLMLFGGRTDEAVERASRPMASTGSGVMTYSLGATVSGRADAALEALDGAFAHGLDDQWSFEAVQLRLARWWSLWLAGRLRESDAYAAELMADAEARRSAEVAAYFSAMLGYSLLLQGRQGSAAARLDAAADTMRRVDRWGQRHVVLSWRAQAAALAGDVEAAERWLEAARGAIQPHNLLFSVMVAIAESWVLGARGHLSAAAEAALAAASIAASRGQHAFEMLALLDGVRFGAAMAAAPRLAALAGRVHGELASSARAFGSALAAGDGGGLDAAAAAFDAIGGSLWAAEAAVEAAFAHRRAGDRARAYAARTAAAELAGRCEGALTPMIARLGEEETDPLTVREREVAMLAATGLSSPQVAQSLGLSSRTVDNHLQQVYRKLGISSRRELSVAFRRTAGV
jgi:ATP/maltotriose-dependent transcriptional regulator MalT